MAYITQQDVQEESGLWHRATGETPSGTADGTNKVFTVSQKPLADNNYDDDVDSDDVVLYADGSSVSVASVDATTGAITATTAPTNGAVMTADYSYSPVSAAAVTRRIEEAEDWINEVMEGVDTVPYTTVPKTIRKVARYYAAGLLMGREWGVGNLTEETTKEGSRKIKQAEKWLEDYKAQILANNADDASTDIPRSSTDQRLFQKYNSTDGRWEPLTDEQFSHRTK